MHNVLSFYLSPFSLGFYFVNYVFDTSLEREIKQTLDESSILKFAFETAALNIPAKYDVLQDDTIEQIAWNLEIQDVYSVFLMREKAYHI